MIEDCFPPCTRFTDVHSTATLKLFVDGDSNVYDVADGACLASRVTPSDCVIIHRWALDGRVLVAVDQQRMLYAIRLADGKVAVGTFWWWRRGVVVASLVSKLVGK